jgi:hypothetical protein
LHLGETLKSEVKPKQNSPKTSQKERKRNKKRWHFLLRNQTEKKKAENFVIFFKGFGGMMPLFLFIFHIL